MHEQKTIEASQSQPFLLSRSLSDAGKNTISESFCFWYHNFIFLTSSIGNDPRCNVLRYSMLFLFAKIQVRSGRKHSEFIIAVKRAARAAHFNKILLEPLAGGACVGGRSRKHGHGSNLKMAELSYGS
jgi:hypothetical protein